MTVNDNRSFKKLIMILIFHKKGFRNKNHETLSQIKKGQKCYWLPLSQIIFGTPDISTIHLFEKKNGIKENYQPVPSKCGIFYNCYEKRR